ncbi:tetratricopeptide repeat protein [Chryseobacterium sp. R2A-55]|uniref:hybrid sensor histidine kinase/response regulator transcription factor n=1 Tax=Chryseobacterium sp. R2A-55 TaxID=2744445 RepID=UPI001F44205E|nr:tetratricopeptide repeat protein [Chryseobacterium sp. R2A-55]
MKKLIILLSILLMGFCGLTAKANLLTDKRIDSLKRVLSKTKDIYQYVDILNHLSQLEIDRENGDKKSALNYAKSAFSSSNKLNYTKGKADALLNIGIAEREMGNYDSALANLETLINISNKTRNIKAKAEAFDQIAHTYRTKKDEKQALKFHFLALALWEKSKDNSKIAASYNHIGEIYFWKLDAYSLSPQYFKKALSIYENLNNKEQIAKTLSNLVMNYRFLEKNTEMLQYAQKMLEVSEEIKEKALISEAYQAIGNVYYNGGDYKKAGQYFEKAVKISESVNDYLMVMQGYSWLSSIYKEQQLWKEAKRSYERLLFFAKKNNNKIMITVAYFGIAAIHNRENKSDIALEYLDLAEKNANKAYLAVIQGLRATIYNKKKEYTKAKEYAERSLAFHQQTGEISKLADNYATLSSINENMGDHKNALKNYKLYHTFQDSLKLDDTSKLVMKYEFGKKETEMKARQESEITRKNTISTVVYGILGTVIILIALILYIYWIRNKKLKLEKQNLVLKRREAELAKETEAFKSRFLSNISHEFRTPLTLINGHLEILKKDGSEKDKKRFDEMEFSGQRLLQLINQLLDLTRLEKDKYQIYFKKGNLLNEAQNYIQAFQSLATQRNINLTMKITESAKDKFYQRDFAYSSETLASVFNNLISNAMKFTPNGGSVQCKIDFRKNKLYFSVSDTGTGIPEKDLPHIFDRFYQVANEEKPIYEGSGIGLAIVKELALLHHGDAFAENNESGGCTFTVWLSEGKTNSDSEHPRTLIPQIIPNNDISVEEIPHDEEKPLILIVEDQRELRNFVVENLGNNFRFLEAENGKQGTELALEHLPDVVISDVMMPEMDGFQLCKSLKENDITSHIPIILLTAKSDQNDKIEGLQSGADDYLTKPFSISELALRVQNRINLQKKLQRKFVGNVIPVQEDAPELNERDRNFLERLNKIIHDHIGKEFNVTDLASEVGLSASQLTRKLKTISGQTPANFIKNIQMELALQMLKNGDSVSETAWNIGFGEPAYFTKVFKKHFGFLPSEKEKLKTKKA